MIFGLPSVTARPAPNRRQADAPSAGSGAASATGARHIFQASHSR